MANKPKVINYLLKYINNNFKLCVGYSGGAIMPIFNGLKIPLIVPSSEASATYIMKGYNKATNNTKCLTIVTSGPGLINCATPIADMYYAKVGGLIISGDVPKEKKNKYVFQDGPLIEITKHITNFNYSLEQVSLTKSIINYIDYLLKNNQTVHLNLPKNIFNEIILNNQEYENKINFNYSSYTEEDINNISSIIFNSKRPVIICGRGCIDAVREIDYLSFIKNIPVTTTLHGLGVYNENNFLSLKMLGMHGSEIANIAIQNADCVICLGAKFDDRIIGKIDDFAKKAKHIIHVNNDLAVFNKVLNNTINIHGRVKDVLNDVNKFFSKTKLNRYNFLSINNKNDDWILFLSKFRKTFPYKQNVLKQQDVLLFLNAEINKLDIKDKIMFVTGVGNHQMYSAQLLTHEYPNRFITSGCLGVMGSCNSMAIGCKLAYEDRIIIAIDGDQSFNMMNDLKTLMNYNIGIKIILMNDGKQSMVNIWEKLFYNKIVATETINPNYEYLAGAYDIKYISINNETNRDEIKKKIKYFLEYDNSKSIILDCFVKSDYCFPLVPPGNALDQMLTYDNFNNFETNNNQIPN